MVKRSISVNARSSSASWCDSYSYFFAQMSVGGLFRFISKPISRWAFKKGDQYFQFYVFYFSQKYIIKYLRKRQKLGLEDVRSMDLDEISSIGVSIADYSQSVVLGKEKITRTHLYNKCCEIDDTLNLQELADFAYKLHKKATERHGIVKAKVREYWLLRAPRLILVFIFLLILVFLIDYLHLRPEMTRVDIQVRFIGSASALFFSLFMVYYRLPDSIASSVAQVMHETYVNTKKSTLKQHKKKDKNKDKDNDGSTNNSINNSNHGNNDGSSSSSEDLEENSSLNVTNTIGYVAENKENVYMFGAVDGLDNTDDGDNTTIDVNVADGSILL